MRVVSPAIERLAANWLGGSRAGWSLAALAICLVANGCGTTRWTDTPRTATEQLLLSDAIDRAIDSFDFTALDGKRVFFDPRYLQSIVDERYVIATMRQHLLASGCTLCERVEEADYVVEARAGAVGTDRNETFFGMPSVSLPAALSVVPGGAALPEMTVAKNTKQRAVAKLAVVAYHRETGRPVWQSGCAPVHSYAKNTWLMGAGPFQRGTIYEGTTFAGEKLPLTEEEKANQTAAGKRQRVSVWSEMSYPDPAVELAQREATDTEDTGVNQAAYLEAKKEGLTKTKPPKLSPAPAPPPTPPPPVPLAGSVQTIDSGSRSFNDASVQSNPWGATQPKPSLVLPKGWLP